MAIVVNKDRLYAYGYPDVNMIADNGCACPTNLTNHRGPFTGLSGVNTQSLLAVAVVYGTLYLLNKMSKRQGLVGSLL